MAKDEININNQGQFVGNVNSPGGSVSVERLQQLNLTDAQRDALNDFMQTPKVREIMESDDPPDKKKGRIESLLSGLTQFSVEVLPAVATKVFTEYVKASGS